MRRETERRRSRHSSETPQNYAHVKHAPPRVSPQKHARYALASEGCAVASVLTTRLATSRQSAAGL